MSKHLINKFSVWNQIRAVFLFVLTLPLLIIAYWWCSMEEACEERIDIPEIHGYYRFITLDDTYTKYVYSPTIHSYCNFQEYCEGFKRSGWMIV